MQIVKQVRGVARLAAVGIAALVALPAFAQITIATGVDGTNTPTACPGDAPQPVDAFTLASPVGGIVYSVRLRLAPLGAWANVSKVEIKSDDLSTLYGSYAPVGDFMNINLVSPIRPTPVATQYKIVLTPRTQAEMPTGAAGKSFAISAKVVSVASNMANTGPGDTTSLTVTIDNAPYADVKVTSVTSPTATSISLAWTAATGATYVVVRQAASPVTATLTDGLTYAVGNNLTGGATVRGVGATASLTGDTAGITTKKAYFYRIFTRDACGNYSGGTDAGPVYPGGITNLEGAPNGSLAPMVGFLNPGNGAVSSPVRVQVRVFSPLDGTTVQPITANSVFLDYDGIDNLGAAHTGSVPLTRDSALGTAADSGIFHVEGGLKALRAGGTYVLRGRAANVKGTVYSGLVSVRVATGKGDGNLLVRDNSEQLCTDCHALQTHSSEATGTEHGSWYAGCRACHTPHGTTNASLVANKITPPALTGVSQPRDVAFSTRTGFSATGGTGNAAAASFANNDRSGVCQVCHTRTDFYLSTGPGEAKDVEVHYTGVKCSTCHKHTEGFKGGGCDGCHGQADRTTFSKVAPPKDTCGNTTSTGGTGKNRVGAHAKHLTGGAFGGAVACASCHIESPTRLDHPAPATCNDADRAAMTWGGIATGGGWTATVIPDYDFVGQTCSTTYCHGAFTNGSNASPSWTGGPMVCGSCHAAPPATTDHSGVTSCGGCHADGYSFTTVDPVDHMNGTLEATGCTGCHGGTKAVVATGAIQAQVDSMPPTDAETAKNTATTFIGVGAHVEHANSNASLALPIACDKCHSWAAFPVGTTHKDLATPMLGSVNWNVTNKTCNSTCHGASTPVWTEVDGRWKQCNDCHAEPAISANHPQNTACTQCHPANYTATTVTGTARATHVDGNSDVNTATGCARCHGTLTDAVAATSINAAPGVNTNVDSKGNLAAATNLAGVGAHKAHLQPRWYDGAVACTQCHPATYSNATHANGAAAVPLTGALPGGSYAANACASTYCHGQFTGGTGADPTWAAVGLTGTSMQCYSCHGTGTSPMPTLAADHPQNTACGTCHTGYTINSVAGAIASHIDGNNDANTTSGCARCHGKLGTDGVTYGADAAPGTTTGHYDSLGNNAATVHNVGAHAVHIQAGAISSAIACSVCHPASIVGTTHADGATGFAWSALARDGVRLSPTYSGSYTCSSVYCHSRANPLGGTDLAPATQAWNVTTSMQCNSCHGDAAAGTLSPKHAKHLAAGPYNMACSVCHSTTVVAGSRSQIGNVANHVNGLPATVATGTFNGVTVGGSYTGASTYTCNTTYCHSNGAGGAPTRLTLAWTGGTLANLDCADCHGGDRLAGVKLVTGSHQAHTDNNAYLGGSSYGCITCHSGTVTGDRALAAGTNHIDGQKDVSASGWVSPNCANQCHSDGTETTPNKSIAWGSGATGGACTECHGSDTTSGAFTAAWGEPNYPNVNTNVDTANSHLSVGHVSRTTATAKTQCVDCHPSTTVDSAGNMVASGTHMDGTRQVGRTGMTYNESTEQCSNIDCHGGAGTTATWGGSLSCDGCHTSATADTDSFVFGTAAKIWTTEWTGSGHGNTTLMGANALPAIGGTNKPCLYCHDSSVDHDLAGNPFRLIGKTGASGAISAGNYSVVSAEEANAPCLNCHGTTGGGFGNGVNAAAQGLKTATVKVNAWHQGLKHLTNLGGRRCWDCHDPHGDGNSKMIGKTVVKQPNDLYSFANTPVARVTATFTRSTPAVSLNYANTTNGASTKVCQTCHTSTAHYTATTADAHNSPYTGGCMATGCHDHDPATARNGSAFEAPESRGGIACEGCHSTIVSGMSSGTAHRHQMAAAQAGALLPAAYPNLTTSQRCLQCHVDHDVFRPDINTVNGGRGKNLRTAYNVQPTSSTGFTNTDHTGTTGICVSCHATAQTKATGLPDAGATTPVIAGATYDASAHDYASNPTSTFGGTLTTTFTANCSKCHTNNSAAQYQTSTNKFALHDGTATSITDDLGAEETGCYKCHSTTVSATQDAYLATTMTATSKDVYTQSQKGTAGGVSTTSTATVLYFKPTTEETPSGTLPTAHLPTGETFAGGTFVARAMTPTTPTVAYETRETTAVSVTATTQTWRRVSFVSPPVATAFTTTANAWNVNIYDSESSANANARVRRSIYTIDSAGALKGTIIARANFATEMGTTAAPGTQQAVTGTATAGVNVAVGDRIVVDLEIQTLTVTIAGNYSMSYFFGSGATSNLTMTTPVSFTYTSTNVASGRHDVGAYSGLHKTVETRGGIAAAKHVECADCHSPHGAKQRAANSFGAASAAGTTTTLNDATKAWTTGQWIGARVTIRSGTRAWLGGTVTANTATQLTFTPAMASATASGDQYIIEPASNGGWVTTAGTGTTITNLGRTWQTNQWVGYTVSVIPAASGTVATRTITANNATTLTVNSAVTTAVNDVFAIHTGAPAVMTGAAGVGVTAWPTTPLAATWSTTILGATYDPATTTAALPAATAEWQVCFKCHSGANANILGATAPGWNAGLPVNGTFTEIATEFNPRNPSYHPVVAALPATDPGANGSSQLTAGQLTNGWQPGQMMTCTDCHNTDAASPAAQGPHGSAIRYMLAGVNKAWPYTVAGATSGTLFRVNTSETLLGQNNGLFCRNCHPAMGGSNGMHTFANTTSHTGANGFPACVACHIRVPHGGRISRLLVTANAPARYKVTGQNLTAAAWTKGTPTSYNGTTGWTSACADHGGTGAESW